MLGKRIKLLTVFGMPLQVDFSWVLLAFLVTVSLSFGYFPGLDATLSTGTRIAMGVAGAIGLFISIILHELAHALVARRYGLSIGGLTLFIFGGVAEMREEPPSPEAEFVMAVAGPITSSIVSAIGFAANALVGSYLPTSITGVIFYLAWINAILVGFNLIPAFPLDGGRMLRSVLWKWKGSLRWATRIGSEIGSGFGLVLLILGFLGILGGNFLAGTWWVLIGIFVRGAARMSYQQLLVRQALEGEPVRRFMSSEPVTVAPGITVAELVEDHIYRHHYKMFPVVENGILSGCVSTRQVKEVPREEWDRRTVGEIAEPCSPKNTLHPDDDAVQALSRMQETGASRLMVVDNGHLEGILSLKDLVKFISLKLDLEQGESFEPSMRLGK